MWGRSISDRRIAFWLAALALAGAGEAAAVTFFPPETTVERFLLLGLFVVLSAFTLRLIWVQASRAEAKAKEADVLGQRNADLLREILRLTTETKSQSDRPINVVAQFPDNRAITRREWQELGDRFRTLPTDVRADWLINSGTPRTWSLRGGPKDIRNADVLCRLAGEMLAKSDWVSNGPLLAEPDALIRWLEFVASLEGAPSEGYGNPVSEDGEQKLPPFFFGSMQSIGEGSARACLACSAKAN